MRFLITAVLLLATSAYGAAALAGWLTDFPFEAIAWTGLILITAWAVWDYFNERGYRADRTSELVG